jgi:hypothetical protein
MSKIFVSVFQLSSQLKVYLWREGLGDNTEMMKRLLELHQSCEHFLYVYMYKHKPKLLEPHNNIRLVHTTNDKFRHMFEKFKNTFQQDILRYIDGESDPECYNAMQRIIAQISTFL